MSEIVVIIRPSFMKFCEDGCRSALFNHLLYWIGKKAKDQPKDKILSGEITYYAKTDALVADMADAWGSKKVRLEVNELVDMGLIGRDKNPKWGADRTKHFYFGKEQYAKLLELCNKHNICLAHIGLSKEIISLLSVFNASVKCPCTGQMVNLPNANGKKAECFQGEQMVKSPLANGKFTTAITQNSSQNSNTQISNERKNDDSQQKPNISEQEGSFTHSSSLSSQIILTEEEQQIIDFAKKSLFKAKTPEISQKLKDECAELALHIKTQEQFDSLLGDVKAKLKAPYHLKNMVNALNDWLQTQPSTSTAPKGPSLFDTMKAAQRQAEESRLREEQAVSDEELAEDLKRIVHAYHDEERFEEHLDRVNTIKQQMRTNNYDMCDRMANTYRKCLSIECSIEDFIEALHLTFY